VAIELLALQGMRNFASLSISPSAQINLIHGSNGSGKTSLLESIHYLAYCKSFRTHKQKFLIQHGQPALTAFCKINGKQLGIERSVKGERRIKLNGEWLHSAAELASILPVQLLDPTMFKGIERSVKGERRIKLNGEWLHSAAELASILPVQLLDPTMFKLLEGSPQYRREYLDWGVFHVEHEFISVWRQFKTAHKTRNALLRQGGCGEGEREIWHQSLAGLAKKITEMRKSYLTK